MSEKPTCQSCSFWDNSASSGHADPFTTGQCRRAAPGFDSRTGLAVWPFTETDDWCGEHSALLGYWAEPNPNNPDLIQRLVRFLPW